MMNEEIKILEKVELKDGEYAAVQQQIVAFAGIVKDMPLEQFLERIDTCEAISPLTNPMLYMKGADRLRAIKRLAEGLFEFQKATVKFAEFVAKETCDGR